MRHYFVAISILIASFVGGGRVYAQVVNYALQLSAESRMESLRELEIEEGAPYTIQFSIKCEEWQQSGVILSLGDFVVEQSLEPGLLEISTPRAHTHKLFHSALRGEWAQLSIVATHNALNIWVNGELWDSYSGDYLWSGESGRVSIGGHFIGQIDELRIFATNLKEDNLSHFNTLNHYHPNWDDMLLYYKFDQKSCGERIVDYRGDNDGYMVGGEIDRIENSDHKSRYMVVSGYSSFIRHNDRPLIDQQMHLMTNDLIMLDAIVDGHSGKIYMQSAENGELSAGAQYANYLDGRSGVLTLDGQGSLSYRDNSHVDLQYLGNALNFSAWMRLEEWREGATLLQKRVSEEDEVTISLTSNSKRGLKVSLDGHVVTFNNLFRTLAQWQHVAVNIEPQGDQTHVTIYIDNQEVARRRIGRGVVINDMEALTHIGQGLVGALDNVVVASASRNNFAEYMSGESRDFNFPNGGAAASLVLGAWFFESEQQVERNSASWQSKIESIHQIYEGYSGYKIRFGIITHTMGEASQKMWIKSILSQEWRATLTEEVARIAPHFDGVDIDFEWLDNNPNNEAWSAYGALIVNLREAIGPDKVLSASLHPVSYTLPLESSVMDCVDYITVQNYGPRHTYLKMDRYEQFFDDALNYGIPAHKIFLSMATLIVRSDNSGKAVSGYKNLDFEGLTPSTNQAIYNGIPYTFNSVEEVKRKMELLRRRGSDGCMYFDMGNDLEVSHPMSLIRALNSVISSNVDREIK